jgi:hypothetical protein
MKRVIIFLLVLAALQCPAAEKKNLPFAPKAKHGKLRTKKCKPVKQYQSWVYRQWGRN